MAINPTVTITGDGDDNILAGISSGTQYSIEGLGGNDSLTGNDAMDTLLGGDGNDTLTGLAGADMLEGGEGDDTYYVDAVDTISETGTGIDKVVSTNHYTLGANLENLDLTIFFGEGMAFFGVGNDGDNSISGAASAGSRFSLVGAAGNDTLVGDDGADTLVGGDGNDVLQGNAGADQLVGGAGNDLYYIDNIGDYFSELAGEGDDTLDISGISGFSYTNGNIEHFVIHGTEGAGFDYAAIYSAADITLTAVIDGLGSSIFELHGGTGNDIITGAANGNSLFGNAGNDTLVGGAGSDLLVGGDGNDTYFITDADQILGELGGIDTVSVAYMNYTLGADLENLEMYGSDGFSYAGEGNAAANLIAAHGLAQFSLSGAAGDDTLKGGAANDELNGGDDRDQLVGYGGNDTLFGGIGNDGVWGGDGNDSAFGGNGADSIGGAAGQDSLYGDAGNDQLYGGNDGDQLFGADGNDSLWGDAGNDYLSGGAGADYIDGGEDGDWIRGGSQADTLLGEDGDDFLLGDWGSDSLTGGAGADTFIINSTLGGSGIDGITDFTSGTDTVYIGRSLTNLTSEGGLWSERLAYGTDASEGDDRFVFDSGTGSLYYDADGSNAGAKVLFATLNAGATLVASDIYMYDSLA